MSKRTELMGFQQAIALPGVRVSRTGMAFERVDEVTLQAAGAFLQAVDAACAWWWGDFLAAYCGFRLKKDEEDNGGVFDELTRQSKLRNYGSDYSVICNREPKTLWHWKSVADFYESSRRREDLTWSHHIEAKEASGGDKAVADNWLDLAVRHKWSHSELRAAIRKKKRGEEAEPDLPEAQSLLPMELTNCRRWASAAIHRVPDMEEKEARAYLAELEQVHALIVALTRRLSPTLSALPQAGGVKESLSASA
jgi:hypothetical protein